jgi:hypothetical protein
MKWTEADMRAACRDIANGSGVRKTASEYRIPYSTLRGRLRGDLPYAVAH